ncbi:phosphate/phosphite/phosphonate ABC transporter substrate-binding protein [Trinickia acidisoli]|uniref:phosphate/phosphite/phosphonate ABC transporter substrate-binding protein n=1 Tax=Trinickia acidisoli TaxID=2767482 RepID=UPI001A8FA697|nr:PhnD/SsuA/transferrin family substrate-binding protein [Trinickia acidisoli]
MTHWIAALPMYNVTPGHGRLWRALLNDTLAAFARAGGPEHVALLDKPHGPLMPLWRRDDLLLSQTCGFPYRMLGLREAVHLVATPIFDAEGCDGPRYRSALVVSAAAWKRGATTLADCFGLRAACNSGDSHSGMNALRHAVAPLARDGRFFASVRWTGAHSASLRALIETRADVAAIDCVTLALLRDGSPELLRGARVIGMTASAPGLPFIASRTLDEAHMPVLRDALDQALAADAGRAHALRLRGFARLPAEDYADIEDMANEARALGYPLLR